MWQHEIEQMPYVRAYEGLQYEKESAAMEDLVGQQVHVYRKDGVWVIQNPKTRKILRRVDRVSLQGVTLDKTSQHGVLGHIILPPLKRDVFDDVYHRGEWRELRRGTKGRLLNGKVVKVVARAVCRSDGTIWGRPSQSNEDELGQKRPPRVGVGRNKETQKEYNRDYYLRITKLKRAAQKGK